MFNWIAEQFEKVIGNFFGWIASAFARLASTVFEWMLSLALNESPNYDAGFLSVWYGRIFAIALPVVVIVASVEITRGALAGRAAHSAKMAFIGSMRAVVAGLLGLPVVALLGGAIDSLCTSLWGLAKGDMDAAVGQVRALYDSLDVNSPLDAAGAASVAVATPLVAALLFIIITAFSVFAATLLWFVLTIRTHLLYICVVALPLAFSGFGSETTRQWPKKIMLFILALALSKIGIVAILGMGLSALGDVTSSATSVATKLSAAISMSSFTTIGAFMPFLAFKLFDFVGGEFMAEGASRQALAPLQKAGENLKGAIGAGLAGAGSALTSGMGGLGSVAGGAVSTNDVEAPVDSGSASDSSGDSEPTGSGGSVSPPPDSSSPATSPVSESASRGTSTDGLRDSVEPDAAVSAVDVEDASGVTGRVSSPFMQDTRPRDGGAFL